MAVIYKQLQAAAAVTLLTTELNSLPSGQNAVSSVAGGTGIFDSTAGGGTTNLDGYPYGRYSLTIAVPPASLNAGMYYLWFLTSIDGTNFEIGSSSTQPNRPPDVVFMPAAGLNAQTVNVTAPIPVGKFKVLLQSVNMGSPGQLATSGNTLKVLAQTNQQI